MSSTPCSNLLPEIGELIHNDHLGHDRHVLVGTHIGPDALDIASWMVPGEVRDPLSALIGYLAPPDWEVLGYSCRTVGRFDRLTVMVDRAGSHLALADDAEGRRCTIGEPAGAIGDLLDRCLGLPTPEPAFETGEWVDAIWLAEVADLAINGERCLGWPDLIALHPYAPDDGDVPEARDLRESTQAMSQRLTWNRLRRNWRGRVDRQGPPGGTPVAEHEWFDDGSFARWHLSCVAPASRSLTDLGLVLPPDLLGLVTAALSRPEAGRET